MPCFERVRPFECIGVQVFGSLTCFLEGSPTGKRLKSENFCLLFSRDKSSCVFSLNLFKHSVIRV